MRILVLGGTRFVGRHLVEAARAGGHAVTVFNRGRTPLPWDGLEQLAGDRETGDLESLRGREWDACLDVNGYLPQHVRTSTALLRDRVAHYAFISTASVYALPGTPPIDETGDVHPVPAHEPDAVAPELYGPLKVACEQEVERVARGGEMLGPGAPSSRVQLVDGRDLAQFATALIGAQATGLFNVCGAPSTFGELLAACASGTGSDARPTWVSEQLLLDAGVEPFDELPLWLPDEPDNRAFYSFSNARARVAGLTLRPLSETARDTWAWIAAVRAGASPAPTQGGFVARGLPREREAALLADQRTRAGTCSGPSSSTRSS